MPNKISSYSTSSSNFKRQAYILIILGLICLLAAWLLHINISEYPIGVMFFGLGMLIACFINPHRLVVASFLTTTLGIAAYLFFKHLISGNEVFPEYIIAIGIALLGIALMARRDYVGAGAVTPGIFVLGVGIIEYWLIGGNTIGGLTPDRFISFMLSLWLPAIGLTILGVIYLFFSMRK
jgi:hypothetical protein